MEDTMTNEYEAALTKSAAAIKEFRAAQLAYRTRTIGDGQFLTAKAVYDAAMSEYDAADILKKKRERRNQATDEQMAELCAFHDLGKEFAACTCRSICDGCGADYDAKWAGTTCSVCDGTIQRRTH